MCVCVCSVGRRGGGEEEEDGRKLTCGQARVRMEAGSASLKSAVLRKMPLYSAMGLPWSPVCMWVSRSVVRSLDTGGHHACWQLSVVFFLCIPQPLFSWTQFRVQTSDTVFGALRTVQCSTVQCSAVQCRRPTSATAAARTRPRRFLVKRPTRTRGSDSRATVGNEAVGLTRPSASNTRPRYSVSSLVGGAGDGARVERASCECCHAHVDVFLFVRDCG